MGLDLSVERADLIHEHKEMQLSFKMWQNCAYWVWKMPFIGQYKLTSEASLALNSPEREHKGGELLNRKYT